MDRFEDDPAGHREEGHAVDEGGEDRNPVEAVGAACVGRAPGEAEGEPGERQGGEVGQHVAGVGEERQRAGEEAARHLGEHEAAGEECRDADGAGAGGVLGRDGVAVRVAVAVIVAVAVVAVGVVVAAHGAARERRAIASEMSWTKSAGLPTAATSAASTVTPQRWAMVA